MSQSMAKRIRMFAKLNGYTSEEKQYHAQKHPRTLSIIGPDGKPKLQKIERVTIIERNRHVLRDIKKMVRAGKIELPTLKQMHAAMAEKKAQESANE